MMKFFGLNSKIKKSSVLLVLLVISLGINLFFLVAWAKKAQEIPLTGTFSSGNKNSIGGEVYFAVTSDGEYTLYQQFQLLENGHCELVGNMLYSDSQAVGYYDLKNTVVLFMDKATYILSRTDTIPTYVNVPGMMNE
ncbi:MAG: hypothetical protein MR837_07415 [Firmicutes bacterium]|nr:hypothetical protein [Bacillota bacterium]MCI6386940.1 hypothetical protein [Bacillota bacterium]